MPTQEKVSVTSEAIRKAISMVSNFSKMRDLINDLQETEPEFMEWVHSSTREDLNRLSDVPLHTQVMNEVQSTILRGKMLSFYIYHLSYVEAWTRSIYLNEDLQERAESIYDAWINGRLPEQYYPVTKKRNSPAAEARRNFLKVRKEQKRIARRIEEVSKKVQTLMDAGMDLDGARAATSIPFVVESGVIEAD
jgi:hypothetical protein